MIQSRPIDLNGRFVGVAVNASNDWHFVAVDPVFDDLDGARFASPEEMTRVAQAILTRSQRQPGLPFAIAGGIGS